MIDIVKVYRLFRTVLNLWKILFYSGVAQTLLHDFHNFISIIVCFTEIPSI